MACYGNCSRTPTNIRVLPLRRCGDACESEVQDPVNKVQKSMNFDNRLTPLPVASDYTPPSRKPECHFARHVTRQPAPAWRYSGFA